MKFTYFSTYRINRKAFFVAVSYRKKERTKLCYGVETFAYNINIFNVTSIVLLPQLLLDGYNVPHNNTEQELKWSSCLHQKVV